MDVSQSQYSETVSGICSNLSELSLKIEELKRVAYELSIKNGFTGFNCKNSTSLSHHLSELYKAVLNVQTGVSKCEVLSKKCVTCLTECIPWLPQRKKHLQVSFLDGNDPWSFWVTYQDKTELDALYMDLRKKYRDNCLKSFVEIPEVGTFVFCIDRKSVFRGMILCDLSDGRFKVINVDTNSVKMVKHENIFHLDSEICQLHSFAVHCCVTQTSKEKTAWDEELSGIFKSTLRECKLEINIINEIDSLPPKFYVELYGYNESLGVSSNLGEWICSRLLPELENLENSKVDIQNLSDSILDPYFDMSTNGNKSVLNNDKCFSQNISEPTEKLTETPHCSNVMVQTMPLTANGLKDHTLGVFFDSITEERPCSSHSYNNGFNPHCKSESIVANVHFMPHEITQDVNISDNCKFISIPVQHRQGEEMDFSGIVPCKKDSVNNNLQFDEVCQNVQPKADHSEQLSTNFQRFENLSLDDRGIVIKGNSSTCNKEDLEQPSYYSHKRIAVDHNKNRKGSSKNFHLVQNNVEDILPSINTDIDAIVGGNYNATDEMRICQFFAKRGYCWKLGCTKEHVRNIEGKWTTDKVEVFGEVFNNLLLPQPGETVDLLVVEVLSAKSFYGHLPDKYSAIDESETDNLETLKSLTVSINNPSNICKYKFLEADPCIGELLLAYGSQNLWLRARVLDVSDESVQIFYIDNGTTDIILLKDNLRKIPPEYLHLPAQAVLCWLGNIYVIDDEALSEEGYGYLETLILNKTVRASIITSNLVDSEMEVIIHTPNRINVNETMVQKGYCIEFCD